MRFNIVCEVCNMCLKSFDIELTLDRSTLKSPSIRMFALWPQGGTWAKQVPGMCEP